MDCDPLGKHSFSSMDDAPHQICDHPCSYNVNMDNDPLGKHSFSFIKDAPHQNYRHPLLHALMDDVPCQIKLIIFIDAWSYPNKCGRSVWGVGVRVPC